MTKTTRLTTSLNAGRPPFSGHRGHSISSAPSAKQSSRATRNLIRSHHNLHKSRAKALADGNDTLVAEIDAQIKQLGGLEAYQAASLTGQRKDRGGDSSTLLVTWLEEEQLVGKQITNEQRQSLRILEVGALSSLNAISAMINKGVGCVKRIDLKSQEPEQIEEIDFMDLPIPEDDSQRFDIVSLSLVLNYVPEAHGRGEMLKKTRSFLRQGCSTSGVLPCLFFVVPLPCISNSRYMDADRLRELMAGLGYISQRRHQSAKLYYELFGFQGLPERSAAWKKMEVNPGKERNNFSITLETM